MLLFKGYHHGPHKQNIIEIKRHINDFLHKTHNYAPIRILSKFLMLFDSLLLQPQSHQTKIFETDPAQYMYIFQSVCRCLNKGYRARQWYVLLNREAVTSIEAPSHWVILANTCAYSLFVTVQEKKKKKNLRARLSSCQHVFSLDSRHLIKRYTHENTCNYANDHYI